MSNNNYSSDKVFKKAIFNIGFQVFPIFVALTLTPFLINGLGKSIWAKYSIGVSLIFLSNYFSFGIGPTLNRRVSEIIGKKQFDSITNILFQSVSFSYILGLSFFIIFQLLLISLFNFFELSILTDINDFRFYFVTIFTFFIVLLIIPYRSLLESFSDFYFLAIMRGITSSMLFIIPSFFLFLFNTSLLSIGITLFVFYTILLLLYYLRVKSFESSNGFSSPNIFNLKCVVGVSKIDFSFISETIYFSIFFLTSATVLFFDRFYYSLYYNTEIISDQVTLLDLFNRVSIITGTISLVYFSAISVWYQENKLDLIKKNLKKQLAIVFFIFLVIISIAYFFIGDILNLWLGKSYSKFIEVNSLKLLVATFFVNFTILLIRPLQSIGLVKSVSKVLFFSTLLYVLIVFFLGYFNKIEYHYFALLIKFFIDIIFLVFISKSNKIL